MSFSQSLITDAAKELLRRRKAVDSLVNFAQAIDIPGKPVSEDPDEWLFNPVETDLAKHHVLMLEVMEWVITGKRPEGARYLLTECEKAPRRAMFFLPPGSAKSSYGSVVAPTWAMGKFPGEKIILASYGSDLARKHGRRARQIAKSKAYQSIFQTKISSETSAADEWALTTGSEYLACGILSGITGNRACLTENCKIQTNIGYLSIRDIVSNPKNIEVESYDHNSRRVVYRPISAVARREAMCIYRIITANGCVVEATGDHRIWTSEGWKEARVLAKGDLLLRTMRQRTNQASLYDSKSKEDRPGENILRSCLPTKSSECSQWKETAHLQKLWGSNGATKEIWKILLRAMQAGRMEKSQAKSTSNHIFKGMRNLWEAISSTKQNAAVAFLFPWMQGYRPKYGCQQGEEPLLQAWTCTFPCRHSFDESIPRVEEYHQGTGRDEVCDLWGNKVAARPSYRPQPTEQPAQEPRNNMPQSSHETTWGGEVCTKNDSVAVVEIVRRTTKVYDIQVDGTECFFTNGLLVHNCGLIIDDPVKGRQDADSETVQQRTKDVYDEDLLTRLIPGGWVMIIQTRWNELDLSGGILPEDYEGASGLIHCRDGNDWYVVCLPAQCERNDDPLGRKPGEFLWPEWFSEEHFKPFMINTRTWNALFQQRPQPETGTFFQREWFHRYNPKQKPNNLYIYGSSDYAVTDDAGDFTEHGVVGVDPDNNIWILDWWHGQTTADIWFESLLDLIAIHKPFCWFGEAGVIKRAIEPFLERRMIERMVYCRHEWLPSIADKPTRARGFQARASQGKIYIPEGETGDRIIDQCLRFPTGSHDDAVDVLSLFCRALDQAHPAIAPRVKKEVPAAQRHIEQIMKGTSRGYEEAVLREQHMQNIMLNREKSRSEGRTYSDVDGR